MSEFGPLFRTGPQTQALRYGFEKAGLTLDNQPIPWNADAVLVEAILRLPGSLLRLASDYCLRVAVAESNIPVESLQPTERGDAWRVSFRFPVPAQSTQVELFFKHRSLGQLTLPVVSLQEFCKRLRIEMPTLSVKLAEHVVSCQTFVGAECKGLVASAVLTSPSSLVALADLGLHVEVRSQKTGDYYRLPVQLASSQLKSKQALLSVAIPKPRHTGAWLVTWKLGERELAAHTVRSISKPQFHRSLQLMESRFLVQNAKGELGTHAQLPPLKGITRVGPYFAIASGEPGMAGTCKLQVRALVKGAVQPPLLHEDDVLVTDGPVVFAPGTLDVSDLDQLEGFEVLAAGAVLGRMPLLPVPLSRFTSEGAFEAAPDFPWSRAAESEFSQRLRKLLGG